MKIKSGFFSTSLSSLDREKCSELRISIDSSIIINDFHLVFTTSALQKFQHIEQTRFPSALSHGLDDEKGDEFSGRKDLYSFWDDLRVILFLLYLSVKYFSAWLTPRSPSEIQSNSAKTYFYHSKNKLRKR